MEDVEYQSKVSIEKGILVKSKPFVVIQQRYVEQNRVFKKDKAKRVMSKTRNA